MPACGFAFLIQEPHGFFCEVRGVRDGFIDVADLLWIQAAEITTKRKDRAERRPFVQLRIKHMDMTVQMLLNRCQISGPDRWVCPCEDNRVRDIPALLPLGVLYELDGAGRLLFVEK